MLAESDSLLQLGITDPFKCNICNKGFLQSNDLIAHNWTQERNRSNAVYAIKRFFRYSVLNRHIRKHTGERPFKCNVCNKGFLRNDHLKEHIRIHLGERPFKCNVCGRNFTQHSGMQKHYRKHTGKGPFKCDVCSKRFLQSNDLIAHNQHIERGRSNAVYAMKDSFGTAI